MSNIFWKATRQDGLDFFTGTVDYAAALESGEPLPELTGDGEFPGNTWYHAATVPTECVGMSWPCRLFEVEPVGDVHRDEKHPHKVGARSLRVLREVEAHRVFGPQGEQVAALIERVKTLTPEEARRLDAERDAAREWARYVASRAARHAARYATRYAASDAARRAAWYATRYAASDAAGALLVRDLIPTEQYDILTGPWRRDIGPIHPDDPTLGDDE